MPNEPVVYTFRFNGSIETKRNYENSTSRLIYELNYHSDEIAAQISESITQVIPSGVSLRTKIHFHEGSIAWDGFINFLDWMARLDGVIGLITLLSNVIKNTVENTLRREFQSREDWVEPETMSVTVESSSAPEQEDQSMSLNDLFLRQEELFQLVKDIQCDQEDLLEYLRQNQKSPVRSNQPSQNRTIEFIKDLLTPNPMSYLLLWTLILVVIFQTFIYYLSTLP